MTIQHHPGEDLLLSYASGALAESWSLVIATHLEQCDQCRRDIALAETIGGTYLFGIDSVAMTEGSLDQVMSRVESDNDNDDMLSTLMPSESPETKSNLILPDILRTYTDGLDIDELPWQRLGGHAWQYLLETRDSEATARLLRIAAGFSVPDHGHNGRELTLVLSGEFQDEISTFGQGDVEDVDEAVSHKPVAGAGADCICLAVTDAPLKFGEFLPRLMQPLFRI